MSTRRRKQTYAQKPVVLPQPVDESKALRLPMFGPGIKITIPLHLWPAYQKIYQLKPSGGYQAATNTLFVKRVPKGEVKS